MEYLMYENDGDGRKNIFICSEEELWEQLQTGTFKRNIVIHKIGDRLLDLS